jgi:hypothetical protein
MAPELATSRKPTEKEAHFFLTILNSMKNKPDVSPQHPLTKNDALYSNPLLLTCSPLTHTLSRLTGSSSQSVLDTPTEFVQRLGTTKLRSKLVTPQKLPSRIHPQPSLVERSPSVAEPIPKHSKLSREEREPMPRLRLQMAMMETPRIMKMLLLAPLKARRKAASIRLKSKSMKMTRPRIGSKARRVPPKLQTHLDGHLVSFYANEVITFIYHTDIFQQLGTSSVALIICG